MRRESFSYSLLMLRGVRLLRLGVYSTSNSQTPSATRVFERAHAQKHPNTDQYASTVLKRERTTDLKLANFPRELAATLAALPSTSPIPSAPFTDITNGAQSALECGAAAPLWILYHRGWKGADQDRTECTRLAKSIVTNLLIQLKTSAPQLISWIGFSEDGVS